MAGKRPTSIAEYIDAAPAAGQPHLRRLYALLKRVAPDAQEAIKWGNPCFVEPRFLFSFSAHKAHLNFMLPPAGRESFDQELRQHRTSRHFLQLPYDAPLPEDLIRRIAEQQLVDRRARQDDNFW